MDTELTKRPKKDVEIGPSFGTERSSPNQEEIGFLDLFGLIKKSGLWITLGLSLAFGLLTGCYLLFVAAPVYKSTTTILSRGRPDGPFGIQVYRSLVESDRVLQQTARRVADTGLLSEGRALKLGRDVALRHHDSSDSPEHLLHLTAFSESPELSAALTNAWAATLIEESRKMLPTPSAEVKSVVGEQLDSTRSVLEQLGSERKQRLDDFLKREQNLSIQWDDRIGARRKLANEAAAEYKLQTRLLMEKEVNAFAKLDGIEAIDSVIVQHSSFWTTSLSDIVAMRAQLAQTPRVLNLEKTASDETMLELIAEGTDVGAIDNTLISQELNPLYDQLTLRILELESRLKQNTTTKLAELHQLLTRLEKIQVERGAGLEILIASGLADLKALRQRRNHEIGEIQRLREEKLSELDRQRQQLRSLDDDLTSRYNTAVVGTMMNDLETLSVTEPAVINPLPESRGIPIRVGLAMLVGAMAGVVITLIRS